MTEGNNTVERATRHWDDRPRLQRAWEFEDPGVKQARRKFRKSVLWIIGAVMIGAVGTALYQIGAEKRIVTQGYNAAISADLVRLARAQEAIFGREGRFGSLDELGTSFVSSQGVRIRVAADSTGWNASAWHLRTSRVCTITAGTGPATIPDQEAHAVMCR